MAYVFLVTHILCIVFGFLCGTRLGRNGAVGGAGGRANTAAGAGTGSSTASVGDIGQSTESIGGAVRRAAEHNKAAEATVGRMRDIVRRHTGGSAPEVIDGKTNTDA